MTAPNTSPSSESDTDPAAVIAEGSQRDQSMAEERSAQIRRAAYARYEQRGFEAGHEEEDWLAAEAEVDGLLDRTSTGESI